MLIDGFRQLGHTLRELKAYPLTLFFLVAYLIYNDGIQTVITLASQYGTEELRPGADALIADDPDGPVPGVRRRAAAGRAGQAHRRLEDGAASAWCCGPVVLIAAFFLPAGQPVPFMALGAAIGLVLGGSQALSRSLFSQLIPKGKEGEYFGLYEISDKGTSWLGPLLFGLTYQLTGSYRVAIISLMVVLRGRVRRCWPPCRCAGRSSPPATPRPGALSTRPASDDPCRHGLGCPTVTDDAAAAPTCLARPFPGQPHAPAGCAAARGLDGRPVHAAALKFFHGPMDCGKSTLALQIDHNHARQGRRGLVLTRIDRSRGPQVTTRIGLAHEAIEVTDDLDLRDLVRDRWADGDGSTT